MSFREALANLIQYGKLTEFDKTSFESYRRHKFAFKIGGQAGANGLQDQPEKRFATIGDHLVVTYIGGALPVYIRVGRDENPFIRAREGMKIKRDFRDVTVRVGNGRANLVGGLAFGSIEFCTSVGDLLDLPPKSSAITRNFFAEEFTIGQNTFTTIFSLVDAAIATGLMPTVGKHGGTCMIKNTDQFAKLWVRDGAVFRDPVFFNMGSRGFPLDPGQVITLELADVFLDANPTDGWGAPAVYTDASQCKCAILLSSIEVDASAVEQTVNADAVLQ